MKCFDTGMKFYNLVMGKFFLIVSQNLKATKVRWMLLSYKNLKVKPANIKNKNYRKILSQGTNISNIQRLPKIGGTEWTNG